MCITCKVCEEGRDSILDVLIIKAKGQLGKGLTNQCQLALVLTALTLVIMVMALLPVVLALVLTVLTRVFSQLSQLFATISNS